MPAEATRRAVLAAAAALPLLTAGCKGVGVLAAPPRPAPDVALLREAIAAEELMVARYVAAAGLILGTAGAGLAAVLSPLHAQHRAHLDRLRSRLVLPVAGAAPAHAARASPAPRPPSQPGQLAAYLAAAEGESSARLASQLLAAPPSLAQLLASISASEATHVPVLQAAVPAR